MARGLLELQDLRQSLEEEQVRRRKAEEQLELRSGELSKAQVPRRVLFRYKMGQNGLF